MRGSAALALAVVLGCGGGSDFDGDGALDEVDCAPEDPTVYPGAAEVCDDGVDQDCDGLVDLLDPDCWIRNGALDDDGDGDGWTEEDGDCDDTRPQVHPDAEETCGDGLDNDCNGVIDDCPDEGEEVTKTLIIEVSVKNVTGQPVDGGVAVVGWGAWDPAPEVEVLSAAALPHDQAVSLGEVRVELTEEEPWYLMAVGWDAGGGCWTTGGWSELRPSPNLGGFPSSFSSEELVLEAVGWSEECGW